MMKLPATMNRHIAGVSAILAALAILGYASSSMTYRPVASLPESNVTLAENASTETPTNETVLPQLNRIPPNAYGSASGSAESLGQKITSSVKSMLPSIGSQSQTDSTSWSSEDWRIAEEAVANHRRSNRNASASSATTWRPPEEIANHNANQAR